MAHIYNRSLLDKLTQLLAEMKRNERICILKDTRFDVQEWNADIEATSGTWLSVPWLFAECYFVLLYSYY